MHIRHNLNKIKGIVFSDEMMNFEKKQFVKHNSYSFMKNAGQMVFQFISKKFDGRLSSDIADATLLEDFQKAGTQIAEYYEQREFAKAMRDIMALADRANQYIADKEPWQLIKQPDHENEVHDICSLGINLFRLLMIYLTPVVPELSKSVQNFLNDSFSWDSHRNALTNHPINKFKALMQRVEMDDINAMLEASKEQQQAQAQQQAEQQQHSGFTLL